MHAPLNVVWNVWRFTLHIWLYVCAQYFNHQLKQYKRKIYVLIPFFLVFIWESKSWELENNMTDYYLLTKIIICIYMCVCIWWERICMWWKKCAVSKMEREGSGDYFNIFSASPSSYSFFLHSISCFSTIYHPLNLYIFYFTSTQYVTFHLFPTLFIFYFNCVIDSLDYIYKKNIHWCNLRTWMRLLKILIWSCLTCFNLLEIDI